MTKLFRHYCTFDYNNVACLDAGPGAPEASEGSLGEKV